MEETSGRFSASVTTCSRARISKCSCSAFGSASRRRADVGGGVAGESEDPLDESEEGPRMRRAGEFSCPDSSSELVTSRSREGPTTPRDFFLSET